MPDRNAAWELLCEYTKGDSLRKPLQSKPPCVPVQNVMQKVPLKKLKDKAFARSVNRDDIKQGVEELGVDLDEHIRFVIDALRPVQKEIGLNPIA